jgi:hypothetical protein
MDIPKLTCTWPDNPSIPKYASECNRGQIFYFENTFDRACDEIRMEIQSRNFL